MQETGVYEKMYHSWEMIRFHKTQLPSQQYCTVQKYKCLQVDCLDNLTKHLSVLLSAIWIYIQLL